MVIKSSAVILLTLISINASAFFFAGQNSIELLEYINGKKVVTFIDEQDIKDSKNWHPFSDSPPISFNELTGAVKDYINNSNDLKGAELVEIELRPIPHHKEKWHYVVTLETKKDGQARDEYLVVLMNGKVIPAYREPDSIK